MTDARRYRRIQDGHIVGPLTLTEAKGMAGFTEGEFEAETDEPGTFGAIKSGGSGKKAPAKKKPARKTTAPIASGGASGPAPAPVEDAADGGNKTS